MICISLIQGTSISFSSLNSSSHLSFPFHLINKGLKPTLTVCDLTASNRLLITA